MKSNHVLISSGMSYLELRLNCIVKLTLNVFRNGILNFSRSLYAMDINILEAYIEKKGGIIILVSGLAGSDRSVLAKKIERDFKDM